MFRGFAVVAMIQAHVSNATISESIQQTTAFHYLDIFNGTISGCFILIAGFAITLYLEKRWDDVISGGPLCGNKCGGCFSCGSRLLAACAGVVVAPMLKLDRSFPSLCARGCADADFDFVAADDSAGAHHSESQIARTHHACPGSCGCFCTPFVYDIESIHISSPSCFRLRERHPSNSALFPIFPFRRLLPFSDPFFRGFTSNCPRRGKARVLFHGC